MEMETLREMFVDNLQGSLFDRKPDHQGAPEDDQGGIFSAVEGRIRRARSAVPRPGSELGQDFQAVGVPGGKKCKGKEGLLEEGEKLMEEDAEPEVLDAGLIAAAQHVEHYEIAGYGCVRTYAELLGDKNAAKLLQQTLDEEKETDEKLSMLARRMNVEAREAA
jgi:uncharacterized protein DUF892